jgi:hypothetical protein
MNDIDLDGGGGVVSKRYNEENNLKCNFGGIGLGKGGENIKLVTVDSMNLDNIGFIHCDAQGSESFIFSRAIETIKKYRPVILFENNKQYSKYLYNNVCKNYPIWKEEANFDLKKYCMETLNYSKCIDRFNGSIDTLLIPSLYGDAASQPSVQDASPPAVEETPPRQETPKPAQPVVEPSPEPTNDTAPPVPQKSPKKAKTEKVSKRKVDKKKLKEHFSLWYWRSRS